MYIFSKKMSLVPREGALSGDKQSSAPPVQPSGALSCKNAVAEAKREVTKIGMLMGTVDKARRTPGLRLTEEDMEQLRTVPIFDFSDLDAVMTKLECHLVEVRKQQTFAMQAQVPQVCRLCTCVVDA